LAVYSNKTSKLNYRKKRLSLATTLISIFSALLLLVLFDFFEIFSILMLGTFGLLFYPICLFFIFLGILLIINKPIKASKTLIILSVIWIGIFVLIMQMLTSKDIDLGFKFYLTTTFKHNVTAGGVVFGVLLYPLYYLTHNVATYVLLAIMLITITAFIIDRIRFEIKSKPSSITVTDKNSNSDEDIEFVENEYEEEVSLESHLPNKKSELIDDDIFIQDDEDEFESLNKPQNRTIRDLETIAEASKLAPDIEQSENVVMQTPNNNRPEIIVHDESMDFGHNSFIENSNKNIVKTREIIDEDSKDNERKQAALQYLNITKGKFLAKDMPKGIDNVAPVSENQNSSQVSSINQGTIKQLNNEGKLDKLSGLTQKINAISNSQPQSQIDDIYDPNLTKSTFNNNFVQGPQQITIPSHIQNNDRFMPEAAKKVYTGEMNENIVTPTGPKVVQEHILDVKPKSQNKGYNKPPRVYNRPPTDLLVKYSTQIENDNAIMQEKANKIVETLENFKINTKVINAIKGPTFTRYELQMAPGISVNTINPRINDLSMALESKCRVQVPIPNKNAFGIEVPNKKRVTVGLRDIIESSNFQNSKSPLTIALGKDISNECKVACIDKLVHTLVAGSTGSGKSVCLHTILISLLYKSGPDDLKLLLVDPKMVEFAMYNKLPHMLIPNAITDCDKAVMALNWLVEEMERRYARLSSVSTRNIEGYNESPEVKSGQLPKMYYIVMVFDEVGDYMAIAKKEIEEKVVRLAAKSRAAGIHLILTTQRPTVDVITGTIKTNLPSRIAFAVNSYNDSKTILESAGAESLLGMGDMLFVPKGSNDLERIQCAFVNDSELRNVINYIKENNDAEFDEEIEDQMFNKDTGFSPTNPNEETFDPMLKQCLKFFIKSNKASASSLQGYFAMGYPKANKIVLQMEKAGFISPGDHNNRRTLYMTAQDFEERFGEGIDD